jgi:H+/gluconate symporter-like permease
VKTLLPRVLALAAAAALLLWCAAETGVSPDLAADAVSGLAALAAQMMPP